MNIYSNIIFWMFIISTLFLFLIFSIYCLKYYVNKKFLIIKISKREKIRNMILVSLLGATGTSFVIILNYIGSTAIIPMFRIAFQSLVIKISGFFFGPIVGVTTALITEIGIITYVPVYFHWKITILVVGHGIVSGFSKKLKDKKGFHITQTMFLLFFLILWFLITMFFSTISSSNIVENNMSEIEKFKSLVFNFFNNIKKKFDTLSFKITDLFFLLSICIFIFLILFIFLIIIYLTFFKNKNKKITKFFYNIIPIMFLAIVSEYFISVGISTNMNQDLLGQTNKSADLLINVSLISAPIKLMTNIIIIYSVWKIMNPFLEKRKFNV